MIILTGYMASGKTVIGKRLANYLGLPFFDLDQFIEAETGLTISAMFSLLGEAYFREKERDCLQKLLKIIPSKSILAIGGGTPCYFNNMTLLKEMGLTVYLETTAGEIKRHLSGQNEDDRPMVMQKKLYNHTAIESHMKERAPFYALSHVKIPLKLAKNPDLLTKTLILFTTKHHDLNYLHEFP